MTNNDPPAELTLDEQHRLTTDHRLRDYPAAELFDDDRQLAWLRFERWLAQRRRLKDR